MNTPEAIAQMNRALDDARADLQRALPGLSQKLAAASEQMQRAGREAAEAMGMFDRADDAATR